MGKLILIKALFTLLVYKNSQILSDKTINKLKNNTSYNINSKRLVNNTIINMGKRHYSTSSKRHYSTSSKKFEVFLVKKSFFTLLKEKLSKKSFWLSIIVTTFISVLLRYLIFYFFDLDIILEIFKFSLSGFGYTGLMLLIKNISNEFFAYQCNELVPHSYSMSSNQTGGGNNQIGVGNQAGVNNNQIGVGNQAGVNNNQANWGPANQPIANQANGPMQVNDPNNQVNNYVANGNNQPLLRNIGLALDHQSRLGNRTLSRYMFTPQMEAFVMQHILHTNPDLYSRLMHIEGYSRAQPSYNQPKWWNQSNSREFRSNFR